jgi:peptide/nickel transport system permease protein
VRRLVFSLFVVVAVSIIVFLTTRVIGDPVRLMMPLQATPEELARARHAFGFDQPLATQFATFVSGALHGDFGMSLWRNQPAMELVVERLPATFQLVAAGTVLAWAIAIPLGTLAATRPGSLLDRSSTTISLLGVSAPNFWIALVLVFIFAGALRWFPTSGYGGLEHTVLPALTLALLAGGRLTQIVRASMIEELAKPYVATARAKGLGHRRVVAHALRNAAGAISALAAWDLAFMLAGYTVPVEVVFAWPGVGQLAADAILDRDLPVIQAVVLVVSLIVVAVNLLADLVQAALDPRIRAAA